VNVYVAAAFTQVALVKETHAELEQRGFSVMSSWVRHATGEREALETMTDAERWAIADENDRGVRSADVVLVLASPEAKETFAEARYACELGRLVLWVGRPLPLTAYRQGVERFTALSTAFTFLTGMELQRRRRVRDLGALGFGRRPV
jgi:hypothetical protein